MPRTAKTITKRRTATLLVPLHRIPPPKESMKMFRGESPLGDEHSGFKKISYGFSVTDEQFVVTGFGNRSWKSRLVAPQVVSAAPKR